jgi:hypothetical protein
MQFYGQNGYPQEYSHVPTQIRLFAFRAASRTLITGRIRPRDALRLMVLHVGRLSQALHRERLGGNTRGTKRKQSDVAGMDKFVVPYQTPSDRISGSPHGLLANDLPEGTTSVPAGRGRKITTVKKGEDGQTIVKVTVAVTGQGVNTVRGKIDDCRAPFASTTLHTAFHSLGRRDRNRCK